MAESETVELKKSLAELKEGLISITAILNKQGAGEIWFGVRNDGRAVGMDVRGKTLRDLSQAIAAHIEPRIYPYITLETLDGKKCIRVRFSGKEAPYFAFGRAYMRVADEDRQLSVRELEQVILAKHRETLCWDSEPAETSMNDIDPRRLMNFVERADLVWDSVENSMEKLGLVNKGVPLNAATLFFCKRTKTSTALCSFWRDNQFDHHRPPRL